ncbi:MAG: class I SAM-dependent methyltransferase [Ilumatobacteraceae bacterium]
MAAADRFVDRLPTDKSYTGEAARAYDAFMPPGTVFPDDAVHRDVIRRSGGTGLELGCGNGRFLIPALQEGLPVEGIDASADILAICARHASERGLQTVLHEGDIAPLTLDRRFHAIVCPAGSFSLITDVERAHAALRSYHDHLEPGGRLGITLFTVGPHDTTDFNWRLRRTGTSSRTGATYIVHEAVGDDLAAQTLLTYNRAELFDAEGLLVSTELRKIRTRWWHRDEFAAALADAGFADVKLLGDEHGWIALAHRP